MSIAKLALFASIAFAGGAMPLHADVLIRVDQSTQRMSVDVDGQPLYDWRVSTGKPGYDTPNGDFRPNRMDADHYSREYNNAPMPHAIFFDLHGHAIHGSYDPVGHPAASHGCVRLDPVNATKLFDLVHEEGMAHTKVKIGGDVTIALRNVKPARKQRIAGRRPHLKETGYGLGEGHRLTTSYDRSYYGAQPDPYRPYDPAPYGFEPAPNRSFFFGER